MSHVDSLQVLYATDESSFDDNAETDLPTPPQSEIAMAPTKTRPGGKKKGAAGAVMARPKRASAGVTKTGGKRGVTKTKGKREALTDISNTRVVGGDAEAVDDFDELNDGAALNSAGTTETQLETALEEKVARLEGSKAPGQNAMKTRRGRSPAAKTNLDEIPETQQDAKATSSLAKATTAMHKKLPRPTTRDVIPETQPEPMDVDDSSIPENEPPSRANGADIINPMSKSRQRPNSMPRRIAGSASDNERGDHERRKFGDMTRKFEALEAKYQNLRDVGVVEAESNFERLRKQTEEKTKAAEELISSLRAELAVQKTAAAEAASMRNQINALTSQNDNLTLENKTLMTSLSEAQNETKTLQAKLAATRSTSNPVQSSDAAGRRAGGARHVLVSTAEAAKEAQKRMLKEDLYSDLTGLVLLDVRRREEEGEDIYDCIQTGRNGTLHFHLIVANPSSTSNTKTTNETSSSYEDAEFQYIPLLDERRDKGLMDILPDYLTDEICFARSSAAKFYARVADCMTKRVELI